MSTVRRPAPELPLLFDGQRLDQVDFHARYEAMPPGTWAELIAGVVHMSSPVGPVHSEDHVTPILWLGYYREVTPGVRVHDNASTVLNARNEVQPDIQMRIPRGAGGQTQVDRLIRGAPELVVEIAHSSRRLDLGLKLAEYERAGVLEYVVRGIEPDEVRWHARRDGKLVLVSPDGDGLYRSTAFPGLWLDPVALLADDTRRLRAVIDLGVATPEHAAFVARLSRQQQAD